MYHLTQKVDGESVLVHTESSQHVATFHNGEDGGVVAKQVVELLNCPRDYYLVHSDGLATCTKYGKLEELVSALAALLPKHPTSAQAFVFIGERCELSRGAPKSLITPEGVVIKLHEAAVDADPSGYLWSSDN